MSRAIFSRGRQRVLVNANTFEETFERIQHGRLPFRAVSFFRPHRTRRCRSVPLVDWFPFSWPHDGAVDRLPVATFGTERLIPGLVAITFTRELGPLLTGIMIAARIGGGVYSGARHHAGFRRSRGHRGHGHRAVALPGRATNARPGLADAVSLHGFEPRGHIASSLVCKAFFSIAFPLFFSTS